MRDLSKGAHGRFAGELTRAGAPRLLLCFMSLVHWIFRIISVLALVSVPGLSVQAATTNDAGAFGHSVHGETFDEGPRQAAYLMPGMPEIDFPVTSISAEAQKFFNQGVGQLHGFWYFEAER